MYAIITPADYWLGHPPLLTLDPSSNTRTVQRRLTRTATLDGGAVIADGGFSDADRTFTLVIRDLSRADGDTLAAIALFPTVLVAVDHGLYLARVNGYAFNGNVSSSITLWIERKII